VTGRLGKRYARALLALARVDGTLQASADDLARAVATLEEPRLRPLLLSPAIDVGARRDTSRRVVEALRLSRPVGNLIRLLADRERLGILPDVARWYEEFVDAELGRARVTIRTAAPVSAVEKSELIELARRLTGRRDVVASTEIDPDILGGVVLDVAGTIYDGSLKAQLARLGREMAEGGV
jgi:F-type H+-transporting ATPase subunit delta